ALQAPVGDRSGRRPFRVVVARAHRHSAGAAVLAGIARVLPATLCDAGVDEVGSRRESGERHAERDRHGPRAAHGLLHFRINPSCTVDATSRPSLVKNCPRARPRAWLADGLSTAYSNQSSMRKLRWNHIAWSRLAIWIPDVN